MNNLLTRLANNDKVSTGMVYGGILLAAIANTLIFTGAHYSALKKGVEIRDEYYFEKEKSAFEKKYGEGR